MFKARRRFNLKAFNNSDKINNFQRNLRRFQSEEFEAGECELRNMKMARNGLQLI